MSPEELKQRIPEDEFKFTASRSRGPGGQNVNKVSTKIELRFNIALSAGLSADEKELIRKKLKNRINSSDDLIIRSQSERTQLKNRYNALIKLLKLLSDALTEKPERKQTEPTIKSQIERVNRKRKRGEIKKQRKDPGMSDVGF